MRLAFAVTSRDTNRFGTLTGQLGTPGGLDAYLVQMSASTGSLLSASRLATPANDAARAVVYSSQSLYLGVVVEGSLGLPLLGGSDLAVLKINSVTSALEGGASFPRAGEGRTNAAALFEDEPVFVGAANSDPLQNPLTDFQAAGFKVPGGAGITSIYWLPQSGGDSEAYSVSSPTLVSQAGNLFITSTRRVFPQPVGWNFIRLDRIVGNTSQWNAVWTAPSQFRPVLLTTPKADVYVQTGTSLVKASRDTVHFNETQPVDGSGIVLRGSALVSISSANFQSRLVR